MYENMGVHSVWLHIPPSLQKMIWKQSEKETKWEKEKEKEAKYRKLTKNNL